MVFTSVRGHLMSLDFPASVRNWQSCDPATLFAAPIRTSLQEGSDDLKRNLTGLSRRADILLLWLDCDREGEAIADEVRSVCVAANPRLRVLRARFSTLVPQEVLNAAAHPVNVDERLVRAVQARQELDLRIGASFTRMLTLALQDRYDFGADVHMLSFGPCQFPTLGFVVERYLDREEFQPEQFWTLKVQYRAAPDSGAAADDAAQANDTTGSHSGAGGPPRGSAANVNRAEFLWNRGSLFWLHQVMALYDCVLETPEAIVTAVRERPTSKFKPRPLATVELQRRAARWYRMSSKQTLDAAEALYNRGILSYPRTETEVFSKDFDLARLVEEQFDHPTWGSFANRLMHDGGFSWPKNGSGDDGAHPPIHPTKMVPPSELADSLEKNVYELVTRHFLACCSKDAIGSLTQVEIDIAGEGFHTSGLMVRERNYLDVYRYEKWSDRSIPVFEVGSRFVPQAIRMVESSTVAPPLLTESDLLRLMDRSGIGTDATMAQHIETIKSRKYVRDVGGSFEPTPLGVALVKAVDAVEFGLSKPALRAKMERDCQEICRGQKDKPEVVADTVATMRAVFMKLRTNMATIYAEFGSRFGAGAGGGADARTESVGLSTCGVCNTAMDLKVKSRGARETFFVHCGVCDVSHRLPGSRGPVVAHPLSCPLCNFQVVRCGPTETMVCPSCFTNKPAGIVGDIEDGLADMPCYKCPAADRCPLAGSSPTVFRCRACREGTMRIGTNRDGTAVNLRCSKYVGQSEGCQHTLWLPKKVSKCVVTSEQCPRCAARSTPAKLCRVTLTSLVVGLPKVITACVRPNCDDQFDLIGSIDVRGRVRQGGAGPPAAASSRNGGGRPASRAGRSQLHLQAVGMGRDGTAAAAAAHNGSRRGPRHDGDASSMRRDSSGGGPVCYNCQAPGHFASDCPSRRNGSEGGGSFGGGGGASAGAAGGGLSCYSCGQAGHFASSCPSKRFGGAGGPSSSRPGGYSSAPSGRGFGGGDLSNVWCLKCKSRGHDPSTCTAGAVPSAPPAKRARKSKTTKPAVPRTRAGWFALARAGTLSKLLVKDLKGYFALVSQPTSGMTKKAMIAKIEADSR